MRWSLVECCAGSAALTLHLLGAKHALLPYQGSKWKVRKPLEAFLQSHGIEGPPSTVVLNDTGPFGTTWKGLVKDAGGVARVVEELMQRDVREVYDELQGRKVPDDPVRFAAEHLFLQRISVNGKAVRLKSGRWGRWDSPGFNKNSAYGCPGTDRFGPIKPMLPHLVRQIQDVGRRLEGVSVHVSDIPIEFAWDFYIGALKREEIDLGPPFMEAWKEDIVVLFVDPPYEGTTGYSHSRASPIDLGKSVEWMMDDCASRFHLVICCEAKPIDLFLRENEWTKLYGKWKATLLSGATNGESPFRSTAEEWITWKRVGEPLETGAETSSYGAGRM